MRIALCTKDDLFGAAVLNVLVPLLASHELGLFMGVRNREAESHVPELDLMRLMERDLPMRVVFPLAEARGGPAGAGMATPRQLAVRTGRPLVFIADMRPDGGMRQLAAFAPELILSVRFSHLFRRATIAVARHGILNVHPGPLPGYRGLYAPFWQLLGNEPVLRWTMHVVDCHVDTGPVLATGSVPVMPGRSLFWHAMQLYLAGSRRAAASVAQLAAGAPLCATPQDLNGVGRFGLPSTEDFARFRRSGRPLITSEDYTDCLLPLLPAHVPVSLAS